MEPGRARSVRAISRSMTDSSSSPTVAFLGGGNMAYAMIRGLLERGFTSRERIRVTEPRPERRAELEAELGVLTGDDNVSAVRSADVVVLAVKPQVIDAVLAEIAPVVGDRVLVVSIAAGISLTRLESALGPDTARVVRTMPNTPALVGASATGLAAGRHATASDIATVRAMFEACGVVAVVPESQLDAVTGLSGSGPAYVYLFIEALADGGVRAGLPRDAALMLAAQTVAGAAKMVLDTKQHPGVLKDQVTSPGGTTIAGVHALERAGFRGSVIDAVKAASDRSAELGAGPKKG